MQAISLPSAGSPETECAPLAITAGEARLFIRFS